MSPISEIRHRLEELRQALRDEYISFSELSELESLASYIGEDDIELREAAGMPEFPDDPGDQYWTVRI